MKIYTRTGDNGETSLFSGGRVTKDHARLHAYGTIDELGAVLGLGVALNLNADLIPLVRRVQGELMVLGADLATPLEAKGSHINRVSVSFITRLEEEIDGFEEELPTLSNFILSGGTSAAAALHQGRTICRRAERWMVSFRKEVYPQALIYTNRLSDWLFVLARIENLRAGQEDLIWKPD